MEIQQPNWLYCLSNELHEVDVATMLGKKHRSLSVFDGWAMNAMARIDGSQRYAAEDSLFCIFSIGPEKYSYINIFRNVAESDLTYLRLRYGFNRMYLVDEPAKSILIGNVADSVFIEVHSSRHLEEDDVFQVQYQSIVKIKHCDVT